MLVSAVLMPDFAVIFLDFGDMPASENVFFWTGIIG
ncbi:hypothetical protein HMPREF0358_1327 [Escherichia coli 83972]|nr:hypothetical protein HMPREF0358_1327 [Escherichia coli 83972]